MSEQIRSFRDLDVWQVGVDLALATYDLTAKLPSQERFGLSAQMRRAVVSIPSNVAEGHAFRNRPRAYRRHVRIALGSLAELDTQVELAARLRLADDKSVEQVRMRLIRAGQLLHGLLRALRAVKEDRSDDR